jgi:hypothetical protein
MDAKQNLIMEIFSKTKKELLIDKLNSIESILHTDVISFYGNIESCFSDYFKKLATELKANSNNNTLTIILSSRGGDNEAMDSIYKHVYSLYQSVHIIIPTQIISTGTIFSFLSDVLWINEKSSFSMIDPQVPDRMNGLTSMFYEFKAFNCDFEFIDSDNIDNSFFVSEPVDELYQIQFSAKKKGLLATRKMCFDMLINHQLKDYTDRNERAIKLINRLMNINNPFCSVHEMPIFWHELERYGLKFQKYSDIQNLNKAIVDYDLTIRYMIGKSDDNFYNTTGYGNYLNCLLQSKHTAII